MNRRREELEYDLSMILKYSLQDRRSSFLLGRRELWGIHQPANRKFLFSINEILFEAKIDCISAKSRRMLDLKLYAMSRNNSGDHFHFVLEVEVLWGKNLGRNNISVALNLMSCLGL